MQPRLPPEIQAKARRGPGRYRIERCLYLHVRGNGSLCWVFRYRADGKLRDKGLGCFPTVSYKQAREAAAGLRAEVKAGRDPIDNARAARDAKRLARAKAQTFGACCDEFIAAHEAGWRNAKHRDQWRNTLTTYAADLLPLPVDGIDTALVIKALEPIWTAKTETATRVRQRIEAVLDWAIAREFRQGPNPARWRGLLDKLLPKPSKVKAVTHHAALPHAEIADFMMELRAVGSLASLALQFQILTATRPSEAVGAHWREIDLQARTWTIPAGRMKANREHRVPLSDPALALLTALPHREGFVFPGKPGRPLTIAAPFKALTTLRHELTAHGFRSTFRDWAADHGHPRDVAEAALAHTLRDATEAAYQRSDLFARRAKLMAEWARYCPLPTVADVTPIRKPRRA